MHVETLDALATSAVIEADYRRYIASLSEPRDAALAAALRERVAGATALTKGPYLEITPPFVRGASLRTLMDEGVVDPGFTRLDGPALPLDRPLHRHQEHALRKATAGRSLVVATGTGSGKTESFLLPIINTLLQQQRAGTLGPGVRALLLYPMNALANDQLKRLRELLAATPEITFGRYTGDTNDGLAQARDRHWAQFEEEPLPNELLSRAQMRKTPPHLLLTNYAMLEYLLLRPEDMDLFGGDTWRYIVVDEAHVYDGAKGAEIALLLRRLQERVGAERRLQCIATSATVGSRDEAGDIVRFASDLFRVPFEWDEHTPARQDVVFAERVEPVRGTWGPITPESWRELSAADDPAPRLMQLAAHFGASATNPHDALATERNMAKLREHLQVEPLGATDLARMVFPDTPDSPARLRDLVDVGSRVTDAFGTPLLSARYHLWVSAIEGAFACLDPREPHVRLNRHQVCPEGRCGKPMFEIATCKRCGTVHAHIDQEQTPDGKRFARPTSVAPTAAPKSRSNKRSAWLVLENSTWSDEDDDAEADPNLASAIAVGGDDATFCYACGALGPAQATACPSCGGTTLRAVVLVTAPGRTPNACRACGARGADVIRGTSSGDDATTSVLTTSLYRCLPPGPPEMAERPGAGRRLLTFSDSRQAAAYFAPYLESTYGRIQQRALVLRGVNAAFAGDEGPTMVDEVLAATATATLRSRFLGQESGKNKRDRLAATWTAAELTDSADRQSLEGLGMIRTHMRVPAGVRVPPAAQRLGVGDDFFNLIGELLRTARLQGAMTMPDGVDDDDPIFAPRRGPVWLRGVAGEPVRGRKRPAGILTWVPSPGRSNRRLDYLARVLERSGSQQDPREVLTMTWDWLTKTKGVDWLTKESDRRHGVLHRVNPAAIRISAVAAGESTWRCDACRRYAPVSVLGVCPAMRCPGTLRPEPLPEDHVDQNHYRRSYRPETPIPLSAVEHTAQWRTEAAAQIQQDFLGGKVNVLSCSTTFELGVDVGDLQSVVLRNVPPRTANYLQRAGRAGRRTDSAALVVTHAARRSHDQATYVAPVTMMRGEMRAPSVPLHNVRIGRRHGHSIIMAAFFRDAADRLDLRWSTSGDFFAPTDGSPAGPDLLRDFLSPVPDAVRASLRAALPAAVQEDMDLDGDAWVDHLVNAVDVVSADITNDLEHYAQAVQQAAQDGNFRLADHLDRVGKTIRSRRLLAVLAQRNVLPKYGFPVDVVELRTGHANHDTGKQLELTRDLSMAVSEFAPGAQVVAGGFVWTSAGLHTVPKRDLVRMTYAVCNGATGCGRFLVDHRQDIPAECDTCGSPWRPADLVVPEFGFVVDRAATPAGSTSPTRGRGSVTYVHRITARDERPVQLPGAVLRTVASDSAELVTLNEGPGGGGFSICVCGRGDFSDQPTRQPTRRKQPATGAPAATKQRVQRADDQGHERLNGRGTCHGTPHRQSLAHIFRTDVLRIDAGFSRTTDPAIVRSVLYAILEAGALELQLSRDDIDGTVEVSGSGQRLVLFDTVPGGAGGVTAIAEHLQPVLERALERVTNCECGWETSCYACLRGFRNQHFHEILSRRDAQTVLASWLGTTTKVTR